VAVIDAVGDGVTNPCERKEGRGEAIGGQALCTASVRLAGLMALPALEGLHVAAFASRAKRTVFGYAASRVAKVLEKKDGKLVTLAEGFCVSGMRGPLQEAELERAVRRARRIEVE